MKLKQLCVGITLMMSGVVMASTAYDSVSSTKEFKLNTEQLLNVHANSLVNLTIPFELQVLPVVIEYKTAMTEGVSYLSGYFAGNKDKRLSLKYDNGQWSGYINTNTAKYIVGSSNGNVFLTAVGNEVAVDFSADDMFAKINETKDNGVYEAQLDYHKLLTAKPNTEMTLNLPEIGKTALVYEKSEQTESGNTNFIGYLRDYGTDYRAIVTYGTGGAVGKISTPNGEFQLENNKLVNMELAGNVVAQNATPDALVPMLDAQTVQAMSMSKQESNFDPMRAVSNEIVTLDLFLYYTDGFAKRMGTSTALRIDNLVAISNQAYVDSQVFVKLRLVGKKQVAYTDDNSNNTALSEMLSNKTPFTTRATDKSNSGADLMMLLRPFKYPVQSSCGVGYIGGANNQPIKYYANYALSVVSDGKDMNGSSYYCQDLSFVHEIGHNMGSMHDRATVKSQGGGSGVFPYSFGYNGTLSKFGTVMSYTQPRVGKFSNPNIKTCPNNEVCGVIETDTTKSANNALSLNSVRFDVANFTATKIPLTTTTSGTSTTGTKTTTSPAQHK